MTLPLLALLACHRLHGGTGDVGETDDTQASDTDTDTGDVGDTDVPGDADVSLWAAWPNVLLPYDVDVDVVHRRAWVTSLVRPVVVAIDVDAGEEQGVFELGDGVVLQYPQVAVDGAGVAWVMNGDQVFRVDPETGDVVPRGTPATTLRAIVGLPDGGVVVAGKRDDQGHATLVALDAAGRIRKTRDLDVAVLGTTIADHGDDVALHVLDDDDRTALDIVAVPTLDDVRGCPTPIHAENLAQAGDGRFVLARADSVGETRCDGSASVQLHVGNDMKAVIPVGDDVVVLDRNGDDDVRGPNWGEGRVFGAGLASKGGYAIGKHSGFGAIDPTTSTIWMNAEDTTEVWGVPAAGGDPTARVRLGRHVEEIVRDPARPGVVWYTGRLTGTIGRIDLATGEHLETSFDGWPVAPVLHDGELYVVDELTTRIRVVDPDTLDVERELDPGLGDNRYIQLDDLGWDDVRGTLFVTQGQSNVLAEVDPSTGDVVRQWTLGGGELVDPDLHGRLMLARVGDAWVTLRTGNGTLTRVDPDEPEPTATTTLTDDQTTALWTPLLMPPLYATSDGVVYAGGVALSGDDLSARPDRDRDVTRMIGERDDGTLLGWQADAGRVVRLDASGAVVGEVTLQATLDDPEAIYVPEWGDRLVYAVVADARVLSTAAP